MQYNKGTREKEIYRMDAAVVAIILLTVSSLLIMKRRRDAENAKTDEVQKDREN